MGKKKRDAWSTDPEVSLRASTVGPIADFDPRSKPGFDGDRKTGEKLLAQYGDDLADLQEQLFAEGPSGGRRSVLLVLQGMDTAGKGGIVRHVGGTMDPQGLTVRGFGKPTREELAHDFLWRIRAALPPAGKIGIFDRSHYEDVLIGRVNKLAAPDEIEKRYGRINEFEAELASHGTRVIKCFLNVSKDAQKKRFLARVNDPEKYYKFNPADLESRSHWDEYMQAYDLALSRCNEDYAPWYVIPCDHKWYRNWAITRLLIEEIEAMGLTWPPADFDVEQARRQVEAL